MWQCIAWGSIQAAAASLCICMLHNKRYAHTQDSSPDTTPYQVAASPFGASHQMPRAHSAFVPTRAHIFNDSSLLTAESAPQGLLPLALGVGLDGADQAEASPKKAGRLQHLKMRVAVC